MIKQKNANGYIPNISIFLMLTLVIACGGNQKQESSQEPVSTGSSIVVSKPSLTHSIPDTIPTHSIQEPTANEKTPPPSPTTRKECDLAFILVSHPEKNTHIYQVKNFNPEDFQCWTALESHARKECGESMPCRVIYVDASSITPTTVAPDYVDKAVLAKKGIGRYEYTSAWWEIRGAKIWGRTGKGFDYYNSNRY